MSIAINLENYFTEKTVVLWISFVAKLLKCLTAPPTAITLTLAG